MRRRRASWGVLVGVAVSGGLAAANGYLTARSVGVLGLLATVPFLAAAVSTVAGTIAAGLLAAVTAATMGDYDHATWHRDLLAVLAGIAVATFIAAVTAGMKGRRLRQLHHSRAIADVVQQTLLRPLPAEAGGVSVAAHYSSATHGAQVGGDIYEVLATSFGLRVLIGDVRGKGLPAVQLASTALGAFREWAHQLPSVVDLATQLDTSVARNADGEEFVTALVVEVAEGAVDIVNCGHPAPILLRGEEVAELEPAQTSLPLGLGITPTPQHVDFGAGDRLLLYTDGVTDARRRGRFFDVMAEVTALRHHDADELVRRLHRRLVTFTRRRLSDDVAILLLERCDSPGGDVRLSLLADEVGTRESVAP